MGISLVLIFNISSRFEWRRQINWGEKRTKHKNIDQDSDYSCDRALMMAANSDCSQEKNKEEAEAKGGFVVVEKSSSDGDDHETDNIGVCRKE